MLRACHHLGGSPIGFAGCRIAIILITGNGVFVKIASGIRDY